MQPSKESSDQRQPKGRSSGYGAARPTITHRSASARPLAAGVWILAAGTLAWLWTAGYTQTAGDAAPWLILVSWFVYIAQWRPCLRVGASGFEVINGLRDHRIPFGAVEDIEIRYTTTIWAGGKKYVSWGAPTPPTAFGSGFNRVSDLKSRPHSIFPSNERISQPETRTGRDAIVLAWQDARSAGLDSSQGAVASSWNGQAIIVGVLAILSVIIPELL